MKKYRVTWYSGSIENIYVVMKEKIVEANSYCDADATKILPKNAKIDCLRCICYKDHLIYDYGSHSNFIKVEEI